MGFNPLHARVWRGREPRHRHAQAGAGAPRRLARDLPRRGRRARSRHRRPRIEASRARRSAAIVAKGEPVYGINTGFGKLASVRIEAADLARLQRNIVLSHAAGVGEPTPAARRAADARLEAREPRRRAPPACAGDGGDAAGDAGERAHPGRAASGLGRRIGRSRAARAHGGGHDRRRRDAYARGPHDRPSAALARAGLAPVALGPKEGLALLNGTQFSTAYALAALFEAGNLFRTALVTGVLSTEAAKGSDAPFDPRMHALSRHRGQADCAAALRALMAGSAIRESHRRRRRPRAGPLLPALPAAGDGRRARHAAPCRQRAGDRGQRRVRQSADHRRRGRWRCRAATSMPSRWRSPPTSWRSPSARSARSPSGASPCWSTRRCRGLPAFLTPKPGLNSGFMIPQVTAAALVSENKQRAAPGQRRLDPDLRQPGGPRVDGRARRAPPAADGREPRAHPGHRAA